MSQPTPYLVANNFAEDEALQKSGRVVQDSDALDAEFAAIELTIGQLLANLALLQRDDGLLKDQSVRSWNLASDTLALIGGASRWTPRGAWAATTAYALYDLVEQSNIAYLAVAAHTSTSNFAADRAAGRWLSLSPLSGTANLITVTPGALIVGPDLQSALSQIEARLTADRLASDLYLSNNFGGL